MAMKLECAVEPEVSFLIGLIVKKKKISHLLAEVYYYMDIRFRIGQLLF
jgi:hypothetical protein